MKRAAFILAVSMTLLSACYQKGDELGGVSTASAESSAADKLTTERIRRIILADNSLSVPAQQTQVSTVDGTVTLSGMVKTEQERRSLDAKAQLIVGRHNVNDELQVAAP